MTLDFAGAFDLFQKQSTSVDELWKFYSAVALGLLAAVVGSEKLKANRLSVGVIIAGFCFFAVNNAIVIFNSQVVCCELAQMVNDFAVKEVPQLRISLSPINPKLVMLFHGVSDLFIVGAMIAIYRASHSGQSATNLPPQL